MIEGPVDAGEGVVADNFVIDVGGVVVVVGLGFVDVVVVVGGSYHHNGLLRRRGNHLGWCGCRCRRCCRVNHSGVRPDVVVVVP